MMPLSAQHFTTQYLLRNHRCISKLENKWIHVMQKRSTSNTEKNIFALKLHRV